MAGLVASESVASGPITLREALEASLITAIVVATLKRMNK